MAKVVNGDVIVNEFEIAITLPLGKAWNHIFFLTITFIESQLFSYKDGFGIKSPTEVGKHLKTKKLYCYAQIIYLTLEYWINRIINVW